jgi:hypothetical protein
MVHVILNMGQNIAVYTILKMGHVMVQSIDIIAHTKYHGMPFSIITLPTFQSYCIIASYNLHSEINDSTLSYRIRKYRQNLVTYF